jgi:transglutaminase-like putative cysteine protease
VSAAAGTLGRRAPARVGGAASAPVAAARPVSLWAELSLFAALAFIGMLQWARLVEPSSTGRQLLALGVACAAGAALRGIGHLRRSRSRTLLATVAALAGICGALLAAGLPAELLLPGHWDELRAEIRAGMGGIEQTGLPYSGPEEWVRLTLVLGAPALVAVAAGLGFWPARRPAAMRVAALCVLLATFGVGATLDNPGVEVLWGVALLVLSAAWLWIARLEPARRPSALAVALGVGILAVPLAARLNAPAWWDYESWSWFGAERSVRFQWNHEYGPLDWPREGTTLMGVETDTPMYWKASVLDRFDGYSWSRAVPGDVTAEAELMARAQIPGGSGLENRHPEWVEAAKFEVAALSSDLVIGAGVTRVVEGAGRSLASGDGTLLHVGPALERGDEYSIVAYVPQPSPGQLRRAPVADSERRFAGSTLVGVPTSIGDPAVETIAMPLWGERGPAERRTVLASQYADAYRLAREWTADARTPYDAVRAIEGNLRREFSYTPSVPESTFPLVSFLFEDQAGYCQQFAGSMGLMLRLLGIPSRVVSGFAPGAPNSEGVYEVRDFDAHSWVEVYFRGIGWVTFDPTPGVAPAGSQRLGGGGFTAFRGAAPNPVLEQSAQGFRRGDGSAGAQDPAAESGGGAWGVVGLGLLGAASVASIAFAAVAWRRRRALLAGERTEAQVSELSEALRRFGWKVGPRTTLLAIERRAARPGQRVLRRYAAALREHRYAAAGSPPSPGDRRALRRALGAGGLGRRIRALLAIPPGGPART